MVRLVEQRLLSPLQSWRLVLPLPSLPIPFMLPLVLPISETAFPPRTWFAAPSYRM